MTRELTLRITCPQSNMKIGEISSKYIDYLRNEEYIEKYGMIDFLNELEYTNGKDIYNKINSELFDKLMNTMDDELDAEILCDEILDNLEDILENYEKSLDDPEYDVEPTFNEYNSKQNAIIEDNKIPIYVPDSEGKLILKYIDKRLLEGTIEL